jgi:hypothetical protein
MFKSTAKFLLSIEGGFCGGMLKRWRVKMLGEFGIEGERDGSFDGKKLVELDVEF